MNGVSFVVLSADLKWARIFLLAAGLGFIGGGGSFYGGEPHAWPWARLTCVGGFGSDTVRGGRSPKFIRVFRREPNVFGQIL